MTQEAGENKMLPTDREEAWAEFERARKAAWDEYWRAQNRDEAWDEYWRVQAARAKA